MKNLQEKTDPRDWWESYGMMVALTIVTICVLFSKCQGDVAILTQ